MPVEPGMFQLYIHHNFPAFASEIEQCSEISDWFSCADSIRPEREEVSRKPAVSNAFCPCTEQAYGRGCG